MVFQIGDAVKSLVTVRATELGGDVFQEGEDGFAGCTVDVCTPGDIGEVCSVDVHEDGVEIPDVHWVRTGETTIMVPGEVCALQLVRRFPERLGDDPESTGRSVWVTCTRCDGHAQVVEHYEGGHSAIVDCACLNGKCLIGL